MFLTTMEAQDSATLLWGLMAKKVETADGTSHCPETVTALKSPHESTPSKCIHWAPALPVGAAPKVPPPHGNTLQCHPLPMGASPSVPPSLWECSLISLPLSPKTHPLVFSILSALIQPHSSHTLAHTHLPHLPAFHLKGQLASR